MDRVARRTAPRKGHDACNRCERRRAVSETRRSFVLGAAFLFVGLGLGVGTALAATGVAALLVRDASAATAADVSPTDTPAFPALPAFPAPIADAPRGALHLELVERTPSRAVERAEASAEAQARTRSRNANAAVAVR
jgi:hypothetical protein